MGLGFSAQCGEQSKQSASRVVSVGLRFNRGERDRGRRDSWGQHARSSQNSSEASGRTFSGLGDNNTLVRGFAPRLVMFSCLVGSMADNQILYKSYINQERTHTMIMHVEINKHTNNKYRL